MSKNFAGIFSRRSPTVNIERECYTMATVDGDEAEIIMYGEIVEKHPKDWRTGEPVAGNFIVLDEFLDDLQKISGAKNITIRLNSVGGNAYAAIPIHNRLRDLEAKKIVFVDGVALSGGSLLVCAGDIVKVNASSLIMIHKCWSWVFGNFNADELKQLAASNDAVDKSQVAIYKRKTGLRENELLSMMADETYMTGTEAIKKGFADELVEGPALDIAASADRRTLYVNGRVMRMVTPLFNLPKSVPKIQSDGRSVCGNKVLSIAAGRKEGRRLTVGRESMKDFQSKGKGRSLTPKELMALGRADARDLLSKAKNTAARSLLYGDPESDSTKLVEASKSRKLTPDELIALGCAHARKAL